MGAVLASLLGQARFIGSVVVISRNYFFANITRVVKPCRDKGLGHCTFSGPVRGPARMPDIARDITRFFLELT